MTRWPSVFLLVCRSFWLLTPGPKAQPCDCSIARVMPARVTRVCHEAASLAFDLCMFVSCPSQPLSSRGTSHVYRVVRTLQLLHCDAVRTDCCCQLHLPGTQYPSGPHITVWSPQVFSPHIPCLSPVQSPPVHIAMLGRCCSASCAPRPSTCAPRPFVSSAAAQRAQQQQQQQQQQLRPCGGA